MIIGIGLPEGARVEVTEDGKLLIVWDEKDSRRDLWLARLNVWLTEGETRRDFYTSKNLDVRAIEVTGRRKLRMPPRSR